MATAWDQKDRGYVHFDKKLRLNGRYRSIYVEKAQICDYVKKHSFKPLIHYVKKEKRYKALDNKTILKERDIMYASHQDALILSFYAEKLMSYLENYYQENSLLESIAAYRKIGLSNFNFAAQALDFCKKNNESLIIALDITGFFDNLDHKLLKKRLKQILPNQIITDDWYKIYKYVTKHKSIKLNDLKSIPAFNFRIENRLSPICSMREFKKSGLKITTNHNNKGIPQGTPISAVLSNLYMIDFDIKVQNYILILNGFYRRYSDDILIIIPQDSEINCLNTIKNFISEENLEIKDEKTEITKFSNTEKRVNENQRAQYLGFNLKEDGGEIRQSSISKQWRKIKRSFRKITTIGLKKMQEGSSEKIHTKRLILRFTHTGNRNFSSYARNSSAAFGNEYKIIKQVRKIEKEALRRLKAIKNINNRRDKPV